MQGRQPRFEEDEGLARRRRRFGVPADAGDARARPPGITPVPESVAESSAPSWRVLVARTVNLILAGKQNNTATLTLTANATSTVLSDGRIGRFSQVLLEARTASAAAARSAGLYVVPGNGEVTVYHAAFPLGDMTFGIVVVG